ncbi:hypothetical protein D3C85_1414190 [compost metagenome]
MASCTARSRAIFAFISSGRFSYAATMFTQMVSPPTSGQLTHRSIEPIDGTSRHVTSEW